MAACIDAVATTLIRISCPSSGGYFWWLATTSGSPRGEPSPIISHRHKTNWRLSSLPTLQISHTVMPSPVPTVWSTLKFTQSSINPPRSDGIPTRLGLPPGTEANDQSTCVMARLFTDTNAGLRKLLSCHGLLASSCVYVPCFGYKIWFR